MRSSKPKTKNYAPASRRHDISASRNHVSNCPKHVYDEETGQVYRETEVVFSKKHNSDWIGELRNPKVVTKSKVNEHGARTLFQTAVNRCIGEFRSFTPEHFELIPWSIAEQIWHEILNRRSESFHIWRTFSIAYGSEFAAKDSRYLLEIGNPPLPLPEYYKGITSLKRDWLTALRISPKQSTIQDLMALANITNLAVLDLSDGQFYIENRQSVFDERILRSWGEMASSGKAFQSLRVLFLGWQENVTFGIFNHLNTFPALQTVIITDCRHLHQKNRKEWEIEAENSGWQGLHAKRSVKVLRPLLDDKHFYVGNVSNCYYESYNMVDDPTVELDMHSSPFKPILECWLGTPRRWLHIIDEFPGTRTIWLQKQPRTHVLHQPSIEVKELEMSKRAREVVTSSPPAKRAQKDGLGKARPPKHTAAGLLADMGL